MNGGPSSGGSGRSHSLERPYNRLSPYGNVQTSRGPPPGSSVLGTRYATDAGADAGAADATAPTSSRPNSSTNSSVSSPNNTPAPRVENSLHIPSPIARTPGPHVNSSSSASSRPGSKTATNSATPSQITWREKSTKELQIDEKICKLIGQLPTELQQTTSLVLLMMNNFGSGEDCDKGLEARLRQAFQMAPPTRQSSTVNEIDDSVNQINGFSIMDETKSSPGVKLPVNG